MCYRMVLLGDAGHPVGAGQGASMAIEDALVLAQRLAAAPSIPAGLEAYEQARRARVGQMAKAASANRDAKTAGPVGRVLRDRLMPIALRYFFERATGWLYSYDPGSLDSQPATTTQGR